MAREPRFGSTLPGAFSSASMRDWSFAGADELSDGSQAVTANNAATSRWRKKYRIDSIRSLGASIATILRQRMTAIQRQRAGIMIPHH